MADPDRLICVGEIGAAHGVRGEVRLRSFTAEPRAIADYAPFLDEKGEREFALSLRGGNGAMLIASIKGVGDRNEAEKLKGMKLFIPRARLPEPEKGRFYAVDLQGLAAVDEKGKAVGRVTDLLNFGAGDILAIEDEEGREFLVPFKAPYAGKPDMEAGKITVAIPEDWPFSKKNKLERK